VFLARARCLGGTFFLDEPLLHLDDLNRVALLDVLRVLVLADSPAVHLVVTSANRPIVRHLREKLGLLPPRDGVPLLRVATASGTPRSGITIE
jgi:ABC-type molybdenum transport system ATPase subunit/photorepair protein PhrA